MDPTLIGLRTQDFHESLKVVTTFGPKEVKFKNTLLIGKASSLAMHLRGLLYIDQYEQIEYAAASLGINSIELPAVLRELETIDFIRITKSGEQVKRIDVKVPEFRSGYSELGKRWQDLRPNELEQAGIASLEHLHHGPVAVPVLQSQYSLNSNEFAIMSDVMMCGQLLAIQTVDGTPTAYSPLAVDGNPSAYLQWAKRFPNEVTAAIETLSQSQGLAMSDGRIASNKTLMDAIQTGVIMPVTVKDLPLKLQFRRILFAEGYWSPIEVELSNYEDLGNTLKRRSLTDLDVLGIKFDRLFNRTCVVGDCKSGRNVSDANRLFWLRGVKDYFGADLAYYLRPNVDSHIAANREKRRKPANKWVETKNARRSISRRRALSLLVVKVRTLTKAPRAQPSS